MQISVLPPSPPLALRLILASAVMISVGTLPVQAGPGQASGRSISPVSMASDQQDINSGPSRNRSSAPVSQAGSDNADDGLNSGSHKSRSSSAAN